MTTKLSVADLCKAGACNEALELAATLYGSERVPVTIETVTPLAEYVYWAASNLLSASAHEQYLKATAPAREQYRKATDPAREQYRKATDPALKRYLKAIALASEQLRKATGLALEQYYKATSPAREQYYTVCVAAFVTAFNSELNQ